MQFSDALCYALLTITMTATCILAEGRRHELEERKTDRRLNRRDATLIIESMPAERQLNSPKITYRRISKQRYKPPKSKYGSSRTKYGPPKTSRIQTKKYRGRTSNKYGPPTPTKAHLKRPMKPRYVQKKRPPKPVYGPPKKKSPQPFTSDVYQPEPMGFGEPPSSFDNYRPPNYDEFPKSGFQDYQQKPGFKHFQKPEPDFQNQEFGELHKPNPSDFYKPTSNEFHKSNFGEFQNFDDFQNFDNNPQKQGYGEPPVDSYGAPIKSNLHDLTYPIAQSFSDTLSQFDQDTYSSLKSLKSYEQDQNIDNKYAFSKKLPMFTKSNNEIFVTPIPEDTEELGLNSYSDIYNHRQMKNKVKKKSKYPKIINNSWNKHKLKEDDEIIVGGQYAEPPARYIPKFQPSAPMFTDDDEFAPPGHLRDPQLLASATNSPYVNYKNSNMAFSPQNLNDAFSIVDK